MAAKKLCLLRSHNARLKTVMCSLLIFMGTFNSCARSAAIEKKGRTARDAQADVGDYLTKYGYLSSANLETGELRSMDEVTKAVKNLQKMAGLPQSGDSNDPELKKVLGQPRCGIGDNMVGKDPNKPLTFQISDLKWDKKTITFKIISYSPDFDEGQQRRDIHKAFQLWHNVSSLEFREVHQNDKADIDISFGRWHHQDGYPFDGKGGVLAHAFPPGTDRGGDAHFDDDERWSNDGKDGTTDLFTVAAHEFGHSLGIFHSEKREALMYPWYQGYKPNLALSYDDVLAIQTLYGPPNRPVDPARTDRPPMIIPSFPSTSTRQPTLPPRPIPTYKPGTDDPPNPCNTDIDAIASVRGEIFAFKGKWFWRFNRKGELMEQSPIKTSYFWDSLPKDLERIDAITYLFKEDISMFFSGDRYWLLKGRYLYPGTPKQGFPLTNLGFPPEVKRIDSVLTWGFNMRTYFFTGYDYWRLDNSSKSLKLERGYPMPFDTWAGIPVPIDAAFTHIDGPTFFFKGTQYWKFDDRKMKADPAFPKDIGSMWLNCNFNLESSSIRVYAESSIVVFVTILISML